MDITGITLPDRTHAETLRDRTAAANNTVVARTVVWADRAYGTCPQCGQPVKREVPCPVTIDPSAGLLREYSQQHGCGCWLPVIWQQAAPDSPDEPAESEILDTARKVAAAYAGEITAGRERIAARLRENLRDVLDRLAGPLDHGETREDREDQVRTGSETEPGVYPENGQWLAWDFDPDGSGDTITVDEDDLQAAAG